MPRSAKSGARRGAKPPAPARGARRKPPPGRRKAAAARPKRRPKPARPPTGYAALLAGQIPDLTGVDILCGIPAYESARTIENVIRAVETGLRKYFPDLTAAIVVSDGGSEDGTVEVAQATSTKPDEELLLIPRAAPFPKRWALTYPGIPGKGSAFRAIFALAEATGARACAVFDSDLRSITPAWVDSLLGPVLLSGYDFVAPMYKRYKYDGTITNAIAYPATAALYGRRLRQPIGGDFGFSGALAAHWANKEVWESDVARFGIDIWMTTVALVEGYKVCQCQLGAKIHDPKDPTADLAPMFRQVVGSLFALAGRYAEQWPGITEIEPVPSFGFRVTANPEEVRIKVGRLTWRFIEGYMRYKDVWSAVLARETYNAVTRATEEAGDRTEGFVLPADLWAYIVWDYLVAFNLQEVGAALLLDSLIPLYFARTATFMQETAGEDQEVTEQRIESFADLFIERKEYLVRRWEEHGRARWLVEQEVPAAGAERVEEPGEVARE